MFIIFMSCNHPPFLFFFVDVKVGIRPISLTTDCCIASVTPTGQLYCDMLTSRLGVLIGMNGKGAKSSNEIGRMGASMISKGSWNYDLNPDLFKVQYRKNSPKSLLTGKL